jgi:C4-dicarboxylate transporter DctM subunit
VPAEPPNKMEATLSKANVIVERSGSRRDGGAPRRLRLRQFENLIVVLSLGAMILLPLAEMLLRRFFHTGISSAASLVQHFCLVLGMVGGAIAARDERLLSLSTVSTFLKGSPKSAAQIFGHAFGAAISAVLGLAAWQFVQQERGAGAEIAYGIERWMVEAVMPLGFGLIAMRLVWNASNGWKGRALAMGMAALLVALGHWPPVGASHLVLPALILLLTAAVLGAPVFAVLGGAAVILFWGKSQPLAVLPIDHYGLVVNATLPTIPLFTLAGYFLAEGGASKRLIQVCDALVGHFRGGPAIATALACAFFTSFTGASGVTILALGGLLMPILISAKYSERNALGLLTGAGSLGLLFPPCLPLILYAIVANVRIQEMFLGGILPGGLLVALTIGLGIAQGPKIALEKKSFNFRDVARASWRAKWELLLPVVALVALFGGFATPLEAAALTAFYAFAIEVFVYRDLKIFRDVPRVMTECALLVGGVLLILGVALGLTDYLINDEIPDHLLNWVQHSIHSPWLFLLALNLFLLVVGCLMDIFSAIIVVAPLIVPLGMAFGINPIHLGIIFLANLELGYLTPPVGMNLFLSSYRFNKPVSEVTRASLPMLGILFVGVLLITYLPFLTTFLPGCFK